MLSATFGSSLCFSSKGWNLFTWCVHFLLSAKEFMAKYAELKGKKVVIKPSWCALPTIGTIIEAEEEGLWLNMELGVSPSEFSIELPTAVEKRIAAFKNDGLYFIPLSHIHYVLTERPTPASKKTSS
jgi:hypothetical protein